MNENGEQNVDIQAVQQTFLINRVALWMCIIITLKGWQISNALG